MLSDISEILDQTKASLSTERQQRQQIQDQLHHADKEMERLQQELTHVRRTTEKKVISFFLKVFIQILDYGFLQKLACPTLPTLRGERKRISLTCWPCIVDIDTLSASSLTHKVKKHFLHKVDNVRGKKWLN